MKSTDRTHMFLSKLKNLLSVQHVAAVGIFVAAIVCFSFVTTAKTSYVTPDGDESKNLTTYADDMASEAATGFDRAEVKVCCDNHINVYYTLEDTVGELLDELNIQIDEDDEVNFDPEDAIYDDMTIVVSHIKVVNRTLDLPVQYETVRQENPDLEEGTENVITEGVNGSATMEYQITFVNGIASGADTLSHEVTRQPVNEVIEVGTKKPDEDETEAEVVEEEYDSESEESYSSDSSSYDVSTASSDAPSSRYLTMTATAYSSQQAGLSAYTSSGALAQVGIVAADPSVLPLGTRVYITSTDGSWCYGYAVVGDTGVSGNVIDLYFNTLDECYSFGVQSAIVYILD